MRRQDQARVTFKVDGVDLGVWDQMEGGGVEASETTFKPGGMGPQIALGGSAARQKVTLSRHYDEGLHVRYVWLDARAGKGAAVVTKQYLDRDGNAYQAPITWTGTLQSVTPPEHDSEGDDVSMCQVEISPDGPIG